MDKKYWILYHPGAFEWEMQEILYGTEDQLVNKFKKDWLIDELTYEEVMSKEWQDNYNTKIEEFNGITYLK